MEMLENNYSEDIIKQNYRIYQNYFNSFLKNKLNNCLNDFVISFNSGKMIDYDNFFKEIIDDFFNMNNYIYHTDYKINDFRKLFNNNIIDDFKCKIASYDVIDYDVVLKIILRELYLIIRNDKLFSKYLFNFDVDFYKKKKIINSKLFCNSIEF